ncbi:guanylate kinase [Woeseia oceani]|uniref:Guanylate kinase n=1 Tax=Woeseia oceani TaxID=1548547 RepID=A0A193LK56_9GAMM|nr:guanylate kinase [Woeseia oceani]ANO52821.1 guanylate kinase [Woeseia oceani]
MTSNRLKHSGVAANEAPAARLFVIAAPSGAGKTTLVRKLVARNPDIRFSVSYTTRQKRRNEEDGRDYFFVNLTDFHDLQEKGELLESALVFDNYYGTSRQQVEKHLANDHHVLLEIDWQGAQQVRESMSECITIFILPPSRAELERRLRDRQTDSDAVIERRLRDALSDMSHWNEFDYCIVNDDLDRAVDELEAVLRGDCEHCRSARMRPLIEKILA